MVRLGYIIRVIRKERCTAVAAGNHITEGQRKLIRIPEVALLTI